MSDLFRRKSLDRIASPEQLNAYIRVATPSVWLLLSAIIVLLSGMCIWGMYGHMDTTLSVVAVSQSGNMTAYVHEADAQKVEAGARVTVGEVEGSVLSVSTEPVCVDDAFSEYMRHVGSLQSGEWVRPIVLDVECEDGVYAAQIVIDSVSPMSFVLN